MIIAYPVLDLCCELKEDKVLTLVIENQQVFYNLIMDIQNQLEGNSGQFILSEDFTPLELRRNAELITQLVPFTVNQKDLISKLYALLKKKSVDEKMYFSTQKLISEVSDYLYKLTEDENMELTNTVPEDVSGILKAFEVRFDDNGKSLSEKLLEYAITSNELKGKKLLITVNLRSYLNDKDTEHLFQSILLKKINLICIESFEHSRIQYEEILIIDKDMCVI